ncbi:MAG TPA: Rap1a/Tai family immunity protein [Xanthomonadaceae bacterium]
MNLLFLKAAILALLATLPLVTRAGSDDGNQLLSDCKMMLRIADGEALGKETLDNIHRASSCVGRMQGIITTSTMYEASGRLKERLICLPPEGMNNGQAGRVVVKYLESHPDKLHKNGTMLAFFAIVEAFPCSAGEG